MTQQRLGSSGNVEQRDLAGIANAVALTDPDIHAPNDLPEWEPPVNQYGLEVRHLTDKGSSKTANTTVSPLEVRWITGGDLEKYVTEHGETVADVPRSYSSFGDEWTTYFGQVSRLHGGCGIGITEKTLERALRVLSGGGRYKSARYSVIPCGKHPWILTGPEGVVLCSLDRVSSHNGSLRTQEYKLPSGNFIEIQEEDRRVLRGLSRVEFAVPDIEIGCYTGNRTRRKTGIHMFGTNPDVNYPEAANDCETAISFQAQELSRVGELYNRDAVLKKVAKLWSGDFETAIPKWKVGDDTPHGVVVGYEVFETQTESDSEQTRGVNTVFVEDTSAGYTSSLKAITTPIMTEKAQSAAPTTVDRFV